MAEGLTGLLSSSIQIPPVCGSPPNQLNKLTNASSSQILMELSVPGFNGGGTSSSIGKEAIPGIGQTSSLATTDMIDPVYPGWNVQQMVAVAGLVPVCVNVAPGKKRSMFEVNTRSSPKSGSSNTTSKQNWSAVQRVIVFPFRIALVPKLSKLVIAIGALGGVFGHTWTTNWMSCIIVPTRFPRASYSSIMTVTTKFPGMVGVK